MSRFPLHTIETAPPDARPLLAGSAKRFGFVPSPVAKAASSPTALQHLFAGFATFERSSLGHLEREVVAMTVALHNECHYCIAMHSAQLAATHADVVAALRAGSALADERLEALRLFTRAMLETRARPDDATHARFTAAGFTDENALDVTLGVGVYTSSTFLNVLTGAELDPAFAAHAWHAPA